MTRVSYRAFLRKLVKPRKSAPNAVDGFMNRRAYPGASDGLTAVMPAITGHQEKTAVLPRIDFTDPSGLRGVPARKDGVVVLPLRHEPLPPSQRQYGARAVSAPATAPRHAAPGWGLAARPGDQWFRENSLRPGEPMEALTLRSLHARHALAGAPRESASTLLHTGVFAAVAASEFPATSTSTRKGASS